ncbi:hypothetical protein PUN28_016653 [Cardiocondyla obscurior]|uniref:RRM domain-containing protein n=1 Tax=Cardiocondyla obscurior TaxID=286306 RepID=A0AAW2ETY3_9HYME
MDYDKYYKTDTDGYHLHFYNKQRLTQLEVVQKFAFFGKVQYVNFTNNGNGLVFVVYKTLEETEKCIEGLQDSDIHLLPERSKLNNLSKDSGNTDLNRKQNAGKDYTTRRTNENNGSNDSNTYNTHHQNYMHKSNSNIKKDNEFDSSVNRKMLAPLRQQTCIQNNSLDTIDCEKYYRIHKDNTYCVHFFNKKNLSTLEINEIFSSFGIVLSVRSRPEKNNFVLIRYKTHEEITRCIKGLQNHDFITLLPEKTKVIADVKTDERNSSQLQTESAENTERLLEQKKKSIYNENVPNLNKFENANYISDVSHDSKQGYGFDKREYTSMNLPMSKEKYLKQRNSINSNDCDEVTRKNQTELSSSTKTKINTIANRNAQGIENCDVPELISDEEFQSNDSDLMSENSSSYITKCASSNVALIIPMQEIIVANIPTVCGVHYILHLFEKYDPISATIVKTISESNIRYCQVYFKTVRDAKTVEEEFDNFDLFGHNLIVLRSSELIDQID